MRIISKFHDYYDSCKKYDLENFPIYNREKKEIILEQKFSFDKKLSLIDLLPKTSISIRRYSNASMSVKAILIFFCGKKFIGYKLSRTYSGLMVKPSLDKICYTIEDIEEFIQHAEDIDQKDFYSTKNHFGYFNHRIVKEILSKNGETFNLDLFSEHKSPVIYLKNLDIRNEFKLTINPNLKDLEFFKVYNAFTAYQEINMFVSGILSKPEKEMPVISDKLKAQSKEFNEWSFRKLPRREI